jgi:trimeric autotransporter adhesin
MFLPLAGMTLLGVSFGSRRKKVLGMLLVFLMASGLLFLASCSSSSSTKSTGNPGTPAGTYTVTVTATSGSTTLTTPFTVTVN